MHTIKVKPIENNLTNNEYSHLASRGQSSSQSRVSVKSTGLRKAVAVFYGMEPDELTRTAYARMKQAPTLESKFPRQVRSSAFRINTGLKKNPEFKKNEAAFFMQSEPGSRRGTNLHEEKLGNNRLAQAGSNLFKAPVEESESQRFRKAEKAFYLLPSSHASRVGSRPISQQHVVNDQQQHLKDITGSTRRAPVTYKPFNSQKANPNNALRLDSTASMKAAKKAFFLVDSRVSYFN